MKIVQYVSGVMLDDALLKCVVTEVIVFSIVAVTHGAQRLIIAPA